MSRLYNIINAIMAPFGKSLWTGSWSTGDITVTGWSKYSLFLIKSTGNKSLLGYKDGTNLRGFCVAGHKAVMSHYTETFSASSNGDKLTMEYATFLQHTASGNHNAGTSITINEIVGLVPNWGGGS